METYTSLSDKNKSIIKKRLDKFKKYIAEKKQKEYFINEEHKLLCLYRKQYLELQKKLELKQSNYTIKYNKINYNSSKITNKSFNIQLYYNDYNKNFINKLYDNIDVDVLNDILHKNDVFLQSLERYELDSLRYYTYHGDTILNTFLKGLFTIEWLKETYDDYSEKTPFILFDDDDVKYFLFNKQIFDYFKSDEWKYDTLLTKSSEEIFNMYYSISLADYKAIFKLYITDLMNIFNKAPKLTSKLVVYRGVNNDYHLSKKKEEVFVNTFFSSTTFLFDIAYKFLDKKKGLMQRITIDAGLPIIFLEGITFNGGEYEILLPINTFYIVEKPSIKKISVYPSSLKAANKPNIKNIICDIDDTTDMYLSDLHFIGYTKSLKKIQII